jgi:hypothetical protein
MKDVISNESGTYFAGNLMPARVERGAKRFKERLLGPGYKVLNQTIQDVERMELPCRFDNMGKLALMSPKNPISEYRVSHSGGDPNNPAELKRMQLVIDLEGLVNDLGFLACRAEQVFLDIQASKTPSAPLPRPAWYDLPGWFRAIRNR